MNENQQIQFIGDDLKELFQAINSAQQQIKGAVRDAKNAHFKNEYATLESVIQAVKKPLLDQGLFLTQHMGPMIDGKVSLSTMLGHKNGSAMISTATISRGRGQGEQADGSSISYLRRYTIAALLMVPIVDDDGNAANADNNNKRDPNWNDEYRSFMGNAARICNLPKGADLMEHLVEVASEVVGHSKRPSQMTSDERKWFLRELEKFHNYQRSIQEAKDGGLF